MQFYHIFRISSIVDWIFAFSVIVQRTDSYNKTINDWFREKLQIEKVGGVYFDCRTAYLRAYGAGKGGG